MGNYQVCRRCFDSIAKRGWRLRFGVSRRAGYLAAGWSVIFAGLHFFWALGGEVGLDVSAGEQLASERPTWFVAGGLWGIGLLCLVGAAVALGLQRRGAHGRRWRALRLLGLAICVLLLVRGVLVEVLLIAGVSTVGEVSAAQKFWTLAVWNPWFILGGVLFGLAARSFGRGMTDRAAERATAIQ
ncbi:DUF3995 domain-containing protein [Streptomyces sp. NPDC001820]|uniref:DUF3995 domain-containing protein n=1 Tax=Streptomyces sp. NPDC001820 TaxID=3364613 RepID=UPI0036B81074